MTALIRGLFIVMAIVAAYGVFMQMREPGPPGLRGVWMHMKRLGGKVRLVLLIYIAVIVISAALRVMGWGIG